MVTTLAKLAAGIVGSILIILGCAYTPDITIWAAVYSYTWVLVGFFLYMMLAGLLLSTGIKELIRLITTGAQATPCDDTTHA